jgi:roadblock/LC7 domain-containing protein
MFRKTTFALVAAAALGAAALLPTAASAHPHFGGHFWFPRLGFYVAGYDYCIHREWVATPYGPRLRWVNVCY